MWATCKPYVDTVCTEAVNWLTCTCTAPIHLPKHAKQECIPEGCIPTAAVAATRCQSQGILPSSLRSTFWRGGLPLTPWADRRFWKHYFPLRSVKKFVNHITSHQLGSVDDWIIMNVERIYLHREPSGVWWLVSSRALSGLYWYLFIQLQVNVEKKTPGKFLIVEL